MSKETERYDHPEERGDGPPRFECQCNHGAGCGELTADDDFSWDGKRYILLHLPIESILVTAAEGKNANDVLSAATLLEEIAAHAKRRAGDIDRIADRRADRLLAIRRESQKVAP